MLLKVRSWGLLFYRSIKLAFKLLYPSIEGGGDVLVDALRYLINLDLCCFDTCWEVVELVSDGFLNRKEGSLHLLALWPKLRELWVSEFEVQVEDGHLVLQVDVVGAPQIDGPMCQVVVVEEIFIEVL